MAEGKETQKKAYAAVHSVEELCTATWKPLYRFIYFKVQNREEAEDITQETFIKAFSYLQSHRIQPDKYFAFLKTVALNVLRDMWRKKKRRGIKISIDQLNPKEISVKDPTDMSAQRMLLEQALHQLSEEQRTVIQLRIIKGYSVAETARLMNKKEVTIRVIQHRALQYLATLVNIPV